MLGVELDQSSTIDAFTGGDSGDQQCGRILGAFGLEPSNVHARCKERANSARFRAVLRLLEESQRPRHCNLLCTVATPTLRFLVFTETTAGFAQASRVVARTFRKARVAWSTDQCSHNTATPSSGRKGV